MRVLLAAHPTVGHTQALRAVGRELLARHHQVRFAIPAVARVPSFLPVPAAFRAIEALSKAIVADGFTLVPLSLSLGSAWAGWNISRARGYDELDWALRLFTGDVQQDARAMIAELRARPADVVIADCFHYGAWIAAESLGIPFVPVFHSGLPFPAPNQPPFGSQAGDENDPDRLASNQRRLDTLSARVDDTLFDVRRKLGLPDVAQGILTRPYSRDLNVLATFEQFELPRPALAASADGPLLWAGPCLGSKVTSVPFPWERLEGAKPVIYVSLGTVFNNQPDVYRTLLAGVHAAGARAVVAAGASLSALEKFARDDDIVVKFAPQVELLGRVNAAVVHGGNNSTNETLRAGKPFLSIPFGGEQVANARRSVFLGVARTLGAGTMVAADVADAVRWLLTPEAAGRSATLARAVPPKDGVGTVVAELESRWRT